MWNSYGIAAFAYMKWKRQTIVLFLRRLSRQGMPVFTGRKYHPMLQRTMDKIPSPKPQSHQLDPRPELLPVLVVWLNRPIGWRPIFLTRENFTFIFTVVTVPEYCLRYSTFVLELCFILFSFISYITSLKRKEIVRFSHLGSLYNNSSMSRGPFSLFGLVHEVTVLVLKQFIAPSWFGFTVFRFCLFENTQQCESRDSVEPFSRWITVSRINRVEAKCERFRIRF